jgi:molybdenum cofactor cytidylyltransferase
MIAAERVALVLLAAGLSARFGPRDKLAEPLGGVPLALHAATMLDAFPFASRIAVTQGDNPGLAACSFTLVVNEHPSKGQGRSIALGMGAIGAAEAVLIALADMPFVAAAHIQRLLDAFDGPDAIVASTDGETPCPPVLFGAAHLAALLRSSGDRGPRELLWNATLVVAPKIEMMDIDTASDLATAERERKIRSGAK